jgi:hypothetical protein
LIVSTTTFRLRDGVDESAFLAADERVQTESVPNLPGFIRRTTARGADGEWIVIALWDTRADAEAATMQSGDDVAVQAFNGLIDSSTHQVALYETLD